MDKHSALIQGLYEIALEDGNTSQLEAIRNNAFAKLATGEVKSIVQSSINSRSFNNQVSLPADELFGVASAAIRLFNNGIITATEPDFSGI